MRTFRMDAFDYIFAEVKTNPKTTWQKTWRMREKKNENSWNTSTRSWKIDCLVGVKNEQRIKRKMKGF